MATKNSNISAMNKNKETIKKVSAKVHEELLNTSHLFIDETVATLTRMQRITGKVIKKSEPILEKQIEITFDAVESLKDQASKGGKRALKLFGLTKRYNKLSATISDKVNEIPSTEEIIENAKEMVASAKSDVEETINKASDSLKSVTSFGEKEVAKKAKKIEKKVVAKTKATKTAVKKAVAKAKVTKKETTKAAATTKKTPAIKKAVTASTSKINTNAKTAKKVEVAKKVRSATTAQIAKSELTQIKGIGASLAAIMADNGIKSINDLQKATPTALKIIANKAGNRYKSFDTNKWIAAANAITK